MISGRFLRGSVGATLSAVACLLAILTVAEVHGVQPAAAAGGRAVSSGISLAVAVGYGNIYRGTGWTPVRVTLRNGTNADVSGVLQIPQSDQSSSVGASASFHGLYQAPVTLAAGATKHVTVYVPGTGVQGRVDVSFDQGSRVLATGTVYPIGIDSSALLVGALAGAPGDIAWLAPAIQRQVTTHVVRLSAATLDPVPAALSTFDIIVLADVDTSQLDRAQLSALQGYVRNGGSLLVIGGPSWQETLRPLPAALLPGTPAGMRVLPNLRGLLPLGSPAGFDAARSAAVSVLTRPAGTVRAVQGGVPLVVRKTEGQGTVEYLAFDPSVSTAPAASPLLERLITMAAPLAITRTWSPQGFRARFTSIFRSLSITGELGNVPPLALPLLTVFAALTILYVLILGPANFLILRRLRRQGLALVTIPLLAFVYLASIRAVAIHLQGSAAVVNAIGLITLDGTSAARPATEYLGLAAPLPGDYRLAAGPVALPAALPQVNMPQGFFPRNATTLQNSPLGMELQEDPQTNVTFLSMPRWTTRDLVLTTSVSVPGAIRSALTIDSRGDLTGAVHNGTNLELQDPIVVAGGAVAHLANLPPGAGAQVRVRPSGETPDWSSLYGGGGFGGSDNFGGFGFRDCCDQVSLPNENKPIDRERNAISMLSQAGVLATPGQVLLVGWSDRPFGALTVDGAAPHRRDLNLVVAPLGVRFPAHGPFQLSAGTLTAHLVDVVPRAPQFSGFGFGPRDGGGSISIGAGGSLTFEFDLPVARPVRFRHLLLSTGNGVDSLDTGRVYDWRAGRWTKVDFSSGTVRLADPNRFVSPTGRILVEIQATQASGDLTIADQYHAVDLSGDGSVT